MGRFRTVRRIMAALAVAAVAVVGVNGLAKPAGAVSNPAFSVFDLPNSPYPAGSRVVALTFDDGPSFQITPGVLDTLSRYGVTATFFVVGQYVAARPDLVQRAIALGHSVQLHTMTHKDLTKLSPQQLAAEVDPEIELLTSVTGRRPTCLRPPYGAWNGSVVNQMAQRGVHSVIWNVNPGDTEAGATAASITSRALAGARPGAVLAMHDSVNKTATLAALPAIIEGIRARGLTPVALCQPPVVAPPPVRDVAVRADGRSGYTLDANGALNAFGGAPAATGTPLPGLARRVVLRADGTSGYVLDGFGGIHPFGGAPAAVQVTGYWRDWDIARGISIRPDGRSGWVVDAFGAAHPWGGAPNLPQSAYWPGWDIARAIVATPAGTGGYVLDGLGGLHPFGAAPAVRNGPYWPGQDRARSLVLGFDGRSGWVVDSAGVLARFGAAPPGRPTHLFGGAGAQGVGLGADGLSGIVVGADGTRAPFTNAPAVRSIALRSDAVSGYTLTAFGRVRGFGGAPPLTGAPVWPDWDIARDIVLRADGMSGYVLDGLGSVHALGGAPAIANTTRFPADLARAAALRADGSSGYTLDAWGGIHRFGGAPSVTGTGYWPGWDITRGIALRPDGASGYVLDGFGGLHPFGGAPRVLGVTGYWPGWDIARGLVLRADGISGWVLDALGATHPFGGAPALPAGTVYPRHVAMTDIAGVAGTDRAATVDAYGNVTKL